MRMRTEPEQELLLYVIVDIIYVVTRYAKRVLYII